MACPTRQPMATKFSHTAPPGPPWVRQLYQIRSKAARGTSRSLEPTLYDHARLSQACSYIFESLPENYKSVSPGGREPTINIEYRPSGAGSKRRRGDWCAPGRWLEERRLLGGGDHRERVYPRA
eukprot:6200222-Pleurochrysis_carterae.AAC.1